MHHSRIIRRAPGLLLLGLVATLVAPAAADAQRGGRFELTPFVGYTFGGDFDVFDPEFGVVNFELDDSVSYGVIFDIPINRFLQVELLATTQDTDLVIDEGLFEPGFQVSGVTVDTFQAGVLWQGSAGQVKPFASAGVGVARLDPEVPGLSSETRPAFNIGGGVKTFFNEHFGLRIDGRLMVIILDSNSGSDFTCCRFDDDTTEITQGQISAGLIVAF